MTLFPLKKNCDFVGSGLVEAFNSYKRRKKGKEGAFGPNKNGPTWLEPKFYQRRKKRGLNSTGKREKRSLTVSDSDTVVKANQGAV